MEFIKKIIEKIKSLFNRNNNLLSEGVEVEEKLEEIAIIEETIEEKNNEGIQIPSRYTKEEFFNMYNNYKEGKIDKSKMLISDLIAVELMLQKENEEYEKKIDREKEVLSNQIIRIKELENKKALLENNKFIQNNA